MAKNNTEIENFNVKVPKGAKFERLVGYAGAVGGFLGHLAYKGLGRWTEPETVEHMNHWVRSQECRLIGSASVGLAIDGIMNRIENTIPLGPKSLKTLASMAFIPAVHTAVNALVDGNTDISAGEYTGQMLDQTVEYWKAFAGAATSRLQADSVNLAGGTAMAVSGFRFMYNLLKKSQQ